MTEIKTKSAYDMLYLTTCALNSVIPDKNKIESMNLENLFEMCQFHSLTCIVCMALESVGMELPEYWTQAKAKAIRKVLLLDAERRKIFDFMDKNGIWYMPLKGVILKEYYPSIGMRQMSDNDILFDIEFQKEFRKFMIKNEYEVKGSYIIGCHEEYHKAPVYNFEMHTRLFDETIDSFSIYYSDVKSRLLKDHDEGFGYHFSDEDFYIYITAHEYKHYSTGGTGLRSLVDIFLYLRAKENSLDRNYINHELEKLGIKDFEQDSCELSRKIFDSVNMPVLTEKEKEMLEYFLFSGTYGTYQQRIKNEIEKHASKTGKNSKRYYIISRIFPDMKFYKLYYPLAYKYKVLIPFAWIFRLFRAVFVRGKRLRSELKIIFK